LLWPGLPLDVAVVTLNTVTALAADLTDIPEIS
jgi:hypothetical protein